MSSLLNIAARIEAAVKAYISVRQMADREVWKEKFEGERVSTPFQWRFERMPSVIPIRYRIGPRLNLTGLNRGMGGLPQHCIQCL
jgi:hypothetical protein